MSDVARIAGVSPITVSRALREPHKVSDKLREQILEVIEDIGYVPNFAARALASRHSGTVAVLAPILEMSGFFHAAHGIEDRFHSSDVTTQFANIGLDAAEEAKLINLFVAQNPAGIILESVAEFPVNKPLITELGCPVVQMMDTSITPLDMGVGIRNRAAAKAAVEHLLSKGYRRIALLGGPGKPAISSGMTLRYPCSFRISTTKVVLGIDVPTECCLPQPVDFFAPAHKRMWFTDWIPATETVVSCSRVRRELSPHSIG
ncbi:MAG: LacI family DNA-binding transcriptional regulator, partial [Martelella sp.]